MSYGVIATDIEVKRTPVVNLGWIPSFFIIASISVAP